MKSIQMLSFVIQQYFRKLHGNNFLKNFSLITFIIIGLFFVGLAKGQPGGYQVIFSQG
jgi:hypothetical protein